MTGVDVPFFVAECADEFAVVGDHTDCAFPVADCDGETAERIAVEKVGGFVQD
jgi:hypothetical protein